ncbi:MAG: hypothetical protein ACRBBN_09855 [Methyloligellaceae bacterium]
MSNDQIKTPGSISDLLSSPTQREISRSISETSDDTQSGWQNYPEQAEMHNTENKKNIEEQAEEILKQLITENTASLVAEQEEVPLTTLPTDAGTESVDQNNITDLIEKVNQQAGMQPPPIPEQSDYQQPADNFQPQQFVAPQNDSIPEPVEFTEPSAPVLQYNNETAATGEDDQLQVEALERWLAKPVHKKDSSSMLNAVMYTTASLAVIMLTYTGVYLTGNYKTFDAPLKQVAGMAALPENLRQGETTSANNLSVSAKPVATSRSDSTGSNVSTFNKNSTGGDSNNTGSGNGGNSIKGKVATAALAIAPAIKPVIEDCPLPVTNLTALPGGFTAIKINSSCRGEQTVDIKYAGISFATRFDQRGNLSFILDCFVGDKESINITYQDGKQQQKTPVLRDMNSLSKIAVIWNSQHNLNLHAFEYASPENSTGHIWEKNPMSLDGVNQKIESNGTGHGFMSSMSGMSKGVTQKIEVYTFMHSSLEIERPGVIKLALGYQTPSASIQQVSCTDTNASYLGYQTVQLLKNQKINREQGQIITNNCGNTASLKKLMPHAIQDLHVGG